MEHKWSDFERARMLYRGRSRPRSSSPPHDSTWFEQYKKVVQQILKSPVHTTHYGIAVTPCTFTKIAYMPYVESMKVLWTNKNWANLDSFLTEIKENLTVKDKKISLFHIGNGKENKVAFDVKVKEEQSHLRVPVIDMGGVSNILFDSERRQDLFVFEDVSEEDAFDGMNLSDDERTRMRMSLHQVYGPSVRYKLCKREPITRYLIQPKALSRALKTTGYNAAYYWDFSEQRAKRYTRKTPWVIAWQSHPWFQITWNVNLRNAPEYTVMDLAPHVPPQ